MRRTRELALAALALGAVACVGHANAPRSSVRADMRYVVDATQGTRITVHASLTTTGASTVVLPDEMVPGLVSFAIRRSGAWAELPLRDRFDVPECKTGCELRYVLDLARPDPSMDTVMHAGGGFVTPTYAWLARPEPLPVGTTRVDVGTAPLDASAADAPFRPVHAHSAVMTNGFSNDDWNEGSFTAFGDVRVAPLAVPGAELDLVRVGTEPKLGERGLVTWAHDAASCVASFFGHFPVARASVFVVPVRNADEVVFGKVLSLGGPAILALTGEQLDASAIHDDWVLVHEMMHLGAPTFFGKLRWLGEGTATYYEAVLRTRCGWRTREELWGVFAKDMPRGMPSPGEDRPLDDGGGIDDVYWGGALFLWQADVRLRTKGSSLDEVMRGVLAEGGDGTQVWTIERFLDAAARLTKTDVLREMYAAHGAGSARIDLARLLADLGIEGTGKNVKLRDDAPLSAVRRAIEGAPPALNR